MSRLRAYYHTRRRCKERYGFKISMQDYREMTEQIRQHRAELVNHHDGGRSFYWVRLKRVNDLRILVAYDDEDQLVLSALPPEAAEDLRRSW